MGYVEEPDGSILVAASSPETHWALNLLNDPACSFSIGGLVTPAVADELDRADHVRVIRELVLRYGTPAEKLGAGPTFRLRPVTASEDGG